MSLGINSFMPANLLRSLEKNQAAQETALGRLSSGTRIRAARDDAAGLAIADRMQSQVRSAVQAMRNANDGISAMQTADGALAQMTTNLQRIRELGVQAANDYLGRSERTSIQQEIEQLMMSNRQIGLETEFNGVKLLDGSFTNVDFQVGGGAGDHLRVSLGAAAKRASTGLELQDVQLYRTQKTGTTVTGALAAGDLSLNGHAVGASVAGAAVLGRSAGSAWAIANAIMATPLTRISTATGLTQVSGNTVTVPLAGGRTLNNGDLTINGVSLGGIFGVDSTAFGNAVKAAIDGSGTGVTASFAAVGNNVTISLASADGGDITVGGNSTIVTTGLYRGKVSITTNVDLPIAAKLQVGGNNPLKAGFAAGTISADPFGVPTPTLVPASSGGEPALSVATFDDATETIRYADRKMDDLLVIRGTAGATQSKLGTVLDTLSRYRENTAAAQSRILDTDYAAETMTLTRTQILQEAGMAVIAQANVLSTLVLDLLEL